MRIAHICVTCGTQYYPSPQAPPRCAICEDERQYVGLDGQIWTNLEEIRKKFKNNFFQEGDGIWGIYTEPKFGIGQRALLLQAGKRNILWDCVSLIDSETVEQIQSRGGLSAIAVSHPHYYTTMIEWSRAFGNIPVYIHEDDRPWVQRPDSSVRFWSGEEYQLGDDMKLIRVGGHFTGYQVLYWATADNGDGALFSGDMPQVCPDRRYVSFMYSYPNYIPVNAQTVRSIVRKLEQYEFQKIYGAWPKFVVAAEAKLALRRSAERYLRAIGDKEPF